MKASIVLFVLGGLAGVTLLVKGFIIGYYPNSEGGLMIFLVAATILPLLLARYMLNRETAAEDAKRGVR